LKISRTANTGSQSGIRPHPENPKDRLDHFYKITVFYGYLQRRIKHQYDQNRPLARILRFEPAEKFIVNGKSAQ